MLKNLPPKLETQRDPLMQSITDALRARLPQATAIIFFGSRVAGVADAFSDYDALVLLPEGLEIDERKRIKQELKSLFPDAKVDLVVGSERWLMSSLQIEAHYRFWIENGIATFGAVPHVNHYPLLYRDALDSRLNIIKSEIDVVQSWSRNLHQEARGYLRILKHLILIEHALRGDYSDQSVWNDVIGLVGMPLVCLLRDSKSVRRVRRTHLIQIRRAVLRKLAQVRQRVAGSKLPSLYPERERVAA